MQGNIGLFNQYLNVPQPVQRLSNKQLICDTTIQYSSMIPSSLPSQLDISMGQDYYHTNQRAIAATLRILEHLMCGFQIACMAFCVGEPNRSNPLLWQQRAFASMFCA